ncbi:LysM peptidoglycan-binding domain-containing protein [Fluviicola taffensis]|uniref:Peptidoglycan-binding lysin domain protein n=1 Tax=Fluviicola taffensis (strain DSM 16823 / NCIMB 13979 / RW262) TaxID=755732 RepID=F2IAC3_FLUTR|nr:LysM peptidoglycan-binding domain-containing protein [Fluviicola taffensis]AEA42058.1 Peptidoglycan-binding lysin domain protein [Fluviicola taffensis DSM 16823]
MRYLKIIFLGILLSSQTLYAQLDSELEAESVDSIVATPKKILHVPEFRKYNPDTIQLSENDLIITDSYTALGQPYVYDALHSFNRRRMDGFGGFLNDKINAGLAEIRSKGFPSDLKKLYIQIDPTTLTVHWTAVVGPSLDGRCYMHVDSRGSAGGGLPAVQKQCPRMHRLHSELIPVKQLEFNDNVLQCYNWDGVKLDTVTHAINIQQHFYKYYDPQIGSSVTLAEVAQKDAEMLFVLVSAPTKAPVKSYKRYTVKQGDTLSQIAQKQHSSPAKIKKANGLRSDLIRVGQTLKIPR